MCTGTGCDWDQILLSTAREESAITRVTWAACAERGRFEGDEIFCCMFLISSPLIWRRQNERRFIDNQEVTDRLMVGKHNALSGDTAPGRTGSSIDGECTASTPPPLSVLPGCHPDVPPPWRASTGIMTASARRWPALVLDQDYPIIPQSSDYLPVVL